MYAHLQVIVTSRQACVLGSMCLVMMILIGFAGVAPHQVPTLALPQITQQTQLVVSIKVRIIFKTVALHEVSNPFHLIWDRFTWPFSLDFTNRYFFHSREWSLMYDIVIQLGSKHVPRQAYIFKANTLKMKFLCAQHFWQLSFCTLLCQLSSLGCIIIEAALFHPLIISLYQLHRRKQRNSENKIYAITRV